MLTAKKNREVTALPETMRGFVVFGVRLPNEVSEGLQLLPEWPLMSEDLGVRLFTFGTANKRSCVLGLVDHFIPLSPEDIAEIPIWGDRDLCAEEQTVHRFKYMEGTLGIQLGEPKWLAGILDAP